MGKGMEWIVAAVVAIGGVILSLAKQNSDPWDRFWRAVAPWCVVASSTGISFAAGLYLAKQDPAAAETLQPLALYFGIGGTLLLLYMVFLDHLFGRK